jgi:P-type E1-E2 ATPase
MNSLDSPVDLPDLKKGESAVYMSIDKILGAVFVFGDSIRDGVPELMIKLHEAGYRTALVSGDGEETTRAIGNAIGIHESFGNRLPGEKSKFIEMLQRQGRTVAMVGDGINDAPALVQADLSFAVHSGSHLGKDAANIILLRGNPVQLLDYLSLVKEVNRKVLQNLIGALVYNVVGVPVAVFGLLSPLIAVTAMFMSSLTVTGNTLLLIRKYSN